MRCMPHAIAIRPPSLLRPGHPKIASDEVGRELAASDFRNDSFRRRDHFTKFTRRVPADAKFCQQLRRGIVNRPPRLAVQHDPRGADIQHIRITKLGGLRELHILRRTSNEDRQQTGHGFINNSHLGPADLAKIRRDIFGPPFQERALTIPVRQRRLFEIALLADDHATFRLTVRDQRHRLGRTRR